jgi:hypothetical protein
MAINDEYIVFGGLSVVYRIGYYLGYLRELARKLNKLISGDEETEMVLSLDTPELRKIEEEEAEASILKKPSVEQDKAALDDLLGFLDDWEKDEEEFEELEATDVTNIVSIPKSIGIEKEVKEVEIIETPPELVEKSTIPGPVSKIEVYDDEVPPIPLDEYAPMEIEDESVSEDISSVDELITSEKAPPEEVLPPLSELPSLEELGPPNFDIESSASEYDTEFVLEEESEALGSVLKELGWSEDED